MNINPPIPPIPPMHIDQYLLIGVADNCILAVEQALDLGADIHVDDDDPLRISMQAHTWDMTQYLLEQGANVHVDDDAPLRAAVWMMHGHMIHMLIRHGADMRVLDDFDQFACHVLLDDMPAVLRIMSRGLPPKSGVWDKRYWLIRALRRHGQYYHHMVDALLLYDPTFWRNPRWGEMGRDLDELHERINTVMRIRDMGDPYLNRYMQTFLWPAQLLRTYYRNK